MKKDQEKEVKASISVSSNLIDPLRVRRRKLLQLGTGIMGGVGATFASWPFIKMMSPSARTEAAGVPITVDLTEINPGQIIREKWRGRPVWVVHRTLDMLKDIKGRTSLNFWIRTQSIPCSLLMLRMWTVPSNRNTWFLSAFVPT